MLRKLSLLFLFSFVFGLLEATVAIYLRTLLSSVSTVPPTANDILLNLKFIVFLKSGSSPKVFPSTPVLHLELLRETSTIFMLLFASLIAFKKPPQVIAAFFYSFAVWDLSYYLFLRILTGWPVSLFSPDIFFLIPVAWLGPVITPIVFSSLLFIFTVVFLSIS